MADDLLNSLLSEVGNITTNKSPTISNHLKETDIFSRECNIECGINNELKINGKKNSSLIHSGDTDSSDDEDNKYHEEQNYNQYGKEIKYLLQTKTSKPSDNLKQSYMTWKNKNNVQQHGSKENPTTIKSHDVYTDPVFGLRIINPVISLTTLQDRMIGRETISFSKIQKFVMGNISEQNWVIGGVIVNKSSVRTSQKGNQFMIWTLSDLKDDIKTVSMFLFGNAYKMLWKTPTGIIVGVLNPSVLDKKDNSKDEASLSVDNAQKVMILGQSKDFGTCKSIKKNGEPCNAIVNKNRCEYCIYHIKQEYQKCSRRSELQSNFTGRGLAGLKKKIFGNNETFTAVLARCNTKLEQKDKNRLQVLSNLDTHSSSSLNKTKSSTKKGATNLEVTYQQRLKDLALLEKLGGSDSKEEFEAVHSSTVTLNSSRNTAVSVISKLKADQHNKIRNGNSSSFDTPKLTKTNTTGTVDLTVGATSIQISRAKLNAIKFVKKNGGLAKSDPNSTKSTPTVKKRILECIENVGNSAKKQKIEENEFLSDRFKRMMEATSLHVDLLNQRDNEEQEKYFHKLEIKEKMEEKMINTYKVPCRAVRCLKCKYTHFSAAQLCKDEKHPLKVYDAVKRFFKCGGCQNRTQTLEIFPTNVCNNCGSSKWERTGMMKEKTTTVVPTLSVRGGEQKFVNSVMTNSNLDLLMPDQ